MTNKTDKNPKRPETKAPEQLTRSWLSAHGFEREVEKIEAKERSRENDPVKREVLSE